jgi:hypothetical protein
MGYGVAKGSQMSVDRGGLSHSRPFWRVLYESAEITITSWYVEIDGVRIAIPDLERMTRCLTYRHPLVKVAAITAGLELVIAAPLAIAYGSAMLACAGLVSGGFVAIGAWADARRNPRYMEIRASVRGRRVVLFGTDDQRVFGHVWRALVRAVEDNRQRLP